MKNKQTIVSFALVISVMSMVLFGCFAIGLVESGAHHACPVAKMAGLDCSVINNNFLVALEHLTGLQQLTVAMIGSVLALGLVLSFSSQRRLRLCLFPKHLILSKVKLLLTLVTKQEIKLKKWLALLQTSEPVMA